MRNCGDGGVGETPEVVSQMLSGGAIRGEGVTFVWCHFRAEVLDVLVCLVVRYSEKVLMVIALGGC